MALIEMDPRRADSTTLEERDHAVGEPAPAADRERIARTVAAAASGLERVDPERVADLVVRSLTSGASTTEVEIAAVTIRTAAGLMAEEPDYSRLASRLLAASIEREVTDQGIGSFSESVAAGHRCGVIGAATAGFVAANAEQLDRAVRPEQSDRFELFGLRTVHDRYLLRHPQSRRVIETPQHFFLRVACGLSTSADEAVVLYDLMSSLEYLPSSPTLFNAGTSHEQMSSCFVAGTPVLTTNRGLIPIEQVQIGDETVTHTGATATVTQLHTNPLGDRALHTLTVAGHDPVTATGNHRIWASRYHEKRGMSTPDWISVEDLDVGDYVAHAVGHDLKGEVFSLVPSLGDYGRDSVLCDAHPDDRIARLADAKPSTEIKVIDGRPFARLQSKTTADPVDTVYNLGVLHDDHSYSVDGLAVANCYLLDSPADELDAIYETYAEIARLSKHAGGIGVGFSRVRSRGSLIGGTNGLSNGVVPWLKTLDASVSAVNQGGRRKGAACVYLETWHADIEEFLELRDGTGDEGRRVRHINLANWVPDLFMRRVEHDQLWSLFDPKVVPHLVDLHGDAFERAYLEAEAAGLQQRQLPARQLYARMMRTLAETGNGWMTFKDTANRTCNQTAAPGNMVHLSNLCTEIIEVSSEAETAVCNLGSINLSRLVNGGSIDFERLGSIVGTVVPYLDRVIDRNYYPTARTASSNARWRPVGLGIMGLQDVFFQLGLAFDSPEARDLSQRISEEIYFNALWASTELAERHGPHPAYPETRAAAGQLQFDLWGIEPSDPARWEPVRARIARHGLRNSLLIALAPTATIAAIAGCYECIEPQVSNLFKRETLSGEFLQVNTYLVRELQQLGLWSEELRAAIKQGDGSIQHLGRLPEELRLRYRTAWEIPQRSLIDMAAERGAFIDQSQSLNLFVAAPTIGKLSSMYLHAWKRGLKTTYYLRSRPATRIAGTTSAPPSNAAAVSCSLESPETCEACD